MQAHFATHHFTMARVVANLKKAAKKVIAAAEASRLKNANKAAAAPTQGHEGHEVDEGF